MAQDSIDFVVTWVDGDDPEWRKEKNEYEILLSPTNGDLNRRFSKEEDGNDDCRFKDYGFLRYWFRGCEAFAPWVNKVFFITCGQRPDWLNIHHPKIVCINHTDYIPDRYLPTFNSNTIELNLHRIASLSERFVLFNDDVFLLKPITPDFFYKDGNPILVSSLKYPNTIGINTWSHFAFNDYCLVNRCHNIRESIWFNRKKWFSVSELGFKKAVRNYLCYIANKTIPVGNYGHIAQPNLKSTIRDVWDKCHDELDMASMRKFRADDQVNQWLFCAWNQALGRFYPGNLENRGMRIHITPSYIDWIVEVVTEQMAPQVCLNDTFMNTDTESCSHRIISAFECILPNKSAFETY